MSLGNAIKYNKETKELEFAEGYRYEDLTDENKGKIDECRYLIESIEGYREDYRLDLENEESSILDKLKSEIAIEVIDDLTEHLEATLQEIQVSLIDWQYEEEN